MNIVTTPRLFYIILNIYKNIKFIKIKNIKNEVLFTFFDIGIKCIKNKWKQ